MESFGEGNEDFQEKVVLPAHHSTHYEEPGTCEQDKGVIGRGKGELEGEEDEGREEEKR